MAQVVIFHTEVCKGDVKSELYNKPIDVENPGQRALSNRERKLKKAKNLLLIKFENENQTEKGNLKMKIINKKIYFYINY